MTYRFRSLLSLALVAGLMLMGSVAVADTAAPQVTAPSHGLGSRWPNATDVSHHPSFHAYRFALNGVSFVQVNAGNGEPQLALATAPGTAVVLPIGNPSAVVVNPANTLVDGSPVIYQDGTVTVQAAPAGYVVTLGCNDPIECSRPPVRAASSTDAIQTLDAAGATSRAANCGDPVECSRINVN
ncbi:hypothetical protein [Dyella japonica]|uniref:hypothetical protein n=1 Tax=Dyella japonica TaxID=231455 RepID=UPI00069A5E49|nr:hypothetical protein [Dyella japonica]